MQNHNMKKILLILLIFTMFTTVVSAAPTQTFHKTLIPITDSLYDIGSTIKKWANGYFDNLTTADLVVTDTSTLGTVISGIWNGTPIDISDYTNLTVDTDFLVLNNDKIEFASTSKNQFSTSWLSGGAVSINGGDNTKFDVSTGTGWVCDNYTDSTNATCTLVSFGPFTAQSVTDIAIQDLTQLAINSSGAIVQQASYTSEERRDVFTIGFVVHTDRTTISAAVQPADVIGFDTALNLYDLSSALGVSINESGNKFTSNGSNLLLDVSAGVTYALGADKSSPKNPNKFSSGAVSPAIIGHVWQDGAGGFNIGAPTTTLDVGRFDDGTGGALEPNGIVASNRWQIFRVFYSANTGVAFIHYDQNTHASRAEALSAINDGAFNKNPALDTLPLRSWILVKGDATDLSNIDQARFCTSDKFGVFPVDCGPEDGVSNMHNYANGVIISAHVASTTSDGSIVTLNVANSVGGNATVQFGGNNFEIVMPTSTPLTAGTNDVPVENFVYFEKNANDVVLLKMSTVGFPSEGDFAAVGTYEVQGAENVQAIGGIYKEHLYDNSLGNGQGKASQIPNRLRKEHAVWESGVALTLTGSGTSNVTMETTSGQIWQVHKGTMPAISSTTPFKVKNDFITPYATSTNIADLDADSLGSTLVGRHYYLTVWGIRSQNASSSGLFINLPNISFNNLTAANAQPTAFDSTVPVWSKGTAFMIAKLLISQSGGGVLTIQSTEDLRGNDPGGISGGSGINVPTDFPDGPAGFTIQNVVDTTKQQQFDASAITTGNTRTMTFPDYDFNFTSPIFGNILSLADSTYDLGSSVNRWANIYADNVDTGTITISSFAQGELTAGWFTATSTTATSTLPRLSVTTGISLMGEYFENFTTYVRSLFTGGTHITITSGSIAVDDDFLLNNGDTGTGTYDFSGATLKMHTYPAFTYSTSTPWTATTTLALGPAYTAEQWDGAKCFTDTGTLNVTFGDLTNDMDVLNASTTVGSFTLNTNNTFTASEKRYVKVGTPVSSPTFISCSVDKIVNN